MKQKTFKVSTFLNRPELNFLYTLEQDIYFNYSIHIPRSKLIQEIIAMLNQNSTLKRKTLLQKLIQRVKKDAQRNAKDFDEKVQ